MVIPSGQSYNERRPVAALAELVSSVWVQQVAPDAAPYSHRNVPNGSVEVICPVGSTPRIVGPLTRPMVRQLAPGSTVVGLRFHPGAAAGVLGLPPSELVDLELDAAQLWGRPAATLGERAASSASPEQAAALVQQLVVDRLAAAADPDPLVAETVRRLGPWRADDVGSLRSSLSISERQLRRRCQAAIGLAPKTLHRMLRFQGFLALVQFALSQGRDPAGGGLVTLAADAGYADQAHLTRECVRLTGVTPGTFLRQTAQACGCGHVHEPSFTPLLRWRWGQRQDGRSVQEPRSPGP
jgi:AraC-like DNA-binding protein